MSADVQLKIPCRKVVQLIVSTEVWADRSQTTGATCLHFLLKQRLLPICYKRLRSTIASWYSLTWSDKFPSTFSAQSAHNMRATRFWKERINSTTYRGYIKNCKTKTPIAEVPKIGPNAVQLKDKVSIRTNGKSGCSSSYSFTWKEWEIFSF